jgi:hypothetical protein
MAGLTPAILFMRVASEVKKRLAALGLRWPRNVAVSKRVPILRDALHEERSSA